MYQFSVGALVIGIIVLILSLRSLNAICARAAAKGWRVLRGLVLFFIVGYIAYLAYLLINSNALVTDALVAAIMLGGSIFVILVSHFSHQSLMEVDRLVAEERHNALHDILTDLPNRQHFQQYLHQCQQSGQEYYLCLVDINSFRQVNDGIGHFYGDQLLCKVGERLQTCVGDDFTLFRIGGDEFAVIARCATQACFEKTIAQIRQQFNDDFELDGYAISMNVAIGALAFQDDKESSDELLKKVDLALARNKQERSPYSLFDEKLESDAQARLTIATKLKTALTNRELEVWYQPIVCARSKKILSAEALIRWPQPDGSYISPEQFIPVAEQDTAINAITEFVLEQVSRDAKVITQRGLDLELHVNLSVRDIQFSGLTERIAAMRASGELGNGKVIFEITESAMITNVERARHTMQAIASMGYMFSVDDFGTGFSSLSLLKHLPVKQIKIDRSFVSKLKEDAADLAIVKSTVFLAKNLGCTLVAEGVEDEDTASMLKDMDCDTLQGYLYSPPRPLEDFLGFAEEYQPESAKVS